MTYPINEEKMAHAYRERFSKDGLEYDKNDDDYIMALAKLLNSAYEAGRKAGLCNKEVKA